MRDAACGSCAKYSKKKKSCPMKFGVVVAWDVCAEYEEKLKQGVKSGD